MRPHLPARARLLIIVIAFSSMVAGAAVAVNTSGRLDVAAATTHALVDYPDPSIVKARTLPQHMSTLQKRAELFGRLMTTTPVLKRISQRAGLPPEQISAVARTTAAVPITLTQPSSEERASQIQDSTLPYRLELQADPAEPILAIYSQAPSTEEAQRLADASIPGLQDYLRELARAEGILPENQVRLRQLGNARGALVSDRAPLLIGGLTFVVVFVLTCGVSIGLLYVAGRWRKNSAGSRLQQEGSLTTNGRSEDASAAADDWPRTTRVLPWMLAAFIALLWLVPFNTIELPASIPFDLKLDRLLLPLIIVAWLLAFVASGVRSPRLRASWIHIAIASFVGLALLSVVVDARYLNQTLELALALKKLPLLAAYVSVFVIVASAVRPTEVRAFMTLTLVLAVVCGIGIIWEYRMDQNLFVIWSERLLPGAFNVVNDVSGEASLDSLGRRAIVGPAQVGVEAVSMLAMALPIALVGLLRDNERRRRILYGVAACVLVAALFATGRKSALLAPIAVVLTIAYFRRRELLALAPLGLVIAVVVIGLSPGAVHGTISQFLRPDAATVATTSDRTADYDAVRPDLWSHLLLGRGYGSYDPQTYRIIDSEILDQAIVTGVLGLVAFVLVGVSVVLAARSTINSRDQTFAPLALIGAAAAVCFLVVSTLFDVLGFPHATYIFLYMAGLVAVVVSRDRRPEAARPKRTGGARLPTALAPTTLSVRAQESARTE